MQDEIYYYFELKLLHINYGPQFCSHLPMTFSIAGVQVGDIGDKLAFEHVDNGFLHMTNIRIPRENLLCKNAEVRRCSNFNLNHVMHYMTY